MRFACQLFFERVSKNVAIEDIHLSEFNRCRNEIDNRTDISEKLVLGQITVLGLAISLPEKLPLLEKVPEVLLGLSVVASFLWLFWLAHTQQISKLAGYIACRLAPQLRNDSDEKTANEWALGWEEYSRIMDRAGPDGYKLHYPPPPSKDVRVSVPLNAAVWKLLLFAGATPVLWFAYGIIVWRNHCALLDFREIITYARIVMVIASVLIWGIAINEYLSVRRIWTAIDDAVIASLATRDAKLKNDRTGEG